MIVFTEINLGCVFRRGLSHSDKTPKRNVALQMEMRIFPGLIRSKLIKQSKQRRYFKQ